MGLKKKTTSHFLLSSTWKQLLNRFLIYHIITISTIKKEEDLIGYKYLDYVNIIVWSPYETNAFGTKMVLFRKNITHGNV
jgi:hypothetical protein